MTRDEIISLLKNQLIEHDVPISMRKLHLISDAVLATVNRNRKPKRITCPTCNGKGSVYQ